MSKDILDYLEDVGVGFLIQIWGSDICISADDARMFAEKRFSRDQVQAYLEGVSLKTYYKWVEWNRRDQLCQALTGRGTQCRNNLRYPRMFGPADFERDGFCDLHWAKFNE